MIDLHAHVFEGVNRTGVNPDLGGVLAGVTTIVDAGSAGSATFGAFPRHIMPSCHTEIVPFLHICQTGLATMPDIIAESSINLGDTLKVLDQHKGLIAGIKARMVSPALEIMGMEMPKLARRAARESGTRLMVHIGDTEKRYDPTVIRKLLPLLEQGDILTHYFTANPGGVLDANGKLVPEAREAADRGVWFDTAHGRMNFSFDVGRRIIEQGLLPHCISTDLTVPGRLMTVHSMTEIMTRFLGLGFTLPQVVTMSTANPAKAIGAEARLGSLRGGAPGRHLGAGAARRRLGGLRRPRRGAAREPGGGPVAHGEARPRVHARLGSAALGLGARSRAARGRGLGRLLLAEAEKGPPAGFSASGEGGLDVAVGGGRQRVRQSVCAEARARSRPQRPSGRAVGRRARGPGAPLTRPGGSATALPARPRRPARPPA